jgi:hypothetical protein
LADNKRCHLVTFAKTSIVVHFSSSTILIIMSEDKSFWSDFRNDLKKYINDIASKYIIEGETSDLAICLPKPFLPKLMPVMKI